MWRPRRTFKGVMRWRMKDPPDLESVPKGGLERRKGMNPKPYPSDLTSQQWAVLKPLLPPARGGRPRKTEMRSVVNAIFLIIPLFGEACDIRRERPRPADFGATLDDTASH